VVAGVDVISRQAFWEFQTIDPNTGQPPVNPLIGFLAVSDTLGNGQGYVSYSITPSKDAFTGDSLNARARIVFDQNTPVLTNEWYNNRGCRGARQSPQRPARHPASVPRCI
jgi:hypothetical protein